MLVEDASGNVYDDGRGTPPFNPNAGGNDVWGTLVKGGLSVVENVALAKVNARREANTQSNQIRAMQVNPFGSGTLYTASPSGNGPGAYNPLFPTQNAYPQAAGKADFGGMSASSLFGIGAILAIVVLIVAAFGMRQ